MALPTLQQTAARLTQSIYYGKTSVGSVPTTRNINTTAPLTGGGNLSSDLTLALTTSPAGQTPVGVTRLINTTAPVTGGGDLSADRTIAVSTFGSGNSGIVPASGGGTTNFLCANGSWSPVAGGAGVPLTRLINTTAPLQGGGDLSADRTLTIDIANITTKGAVPATGGTDSTKFLCMTNPISWVAVPSVGSTVTLQPTTPGTADVGHAHITGTFIAESEVVAGSNNKSLNGLGHEPLYVKMSTPSAPPVVASYWTGDQVSGVTFRSGRGTEASPSVASNGDEIGAIQLEPYYGAGAYDRRDAIRWVKRQTNGPSHACWDVDILASQGNSTDPQPCIRLGSNSLNGIGPIATLAPLSGWEVATSIGLTPYIHNSGTNISATDYQSMFLIDASGGTKGVVLPPAGGRKGRIVKATRVDSTGNACSLSPNGGDSINGSNSSWKLLSAGDTVTVISDGSNWWTLAYTLSADYATAASDVVVANTVAETTIANPASASTPPLHTGYVVRMMIGGNLSTTGTPTMRIRLKNGVAEVLADTGAVTMPSGVTAAQWRVEFVGVARVASSTTRIVKAEFSIAAAGGTGSVMTAYNMVPATSFTNGPLVDTATALWGTASPSNTMTVTDYVMSLTSGTQVV